MFVQVQRQRNRRSSLRLDCLPVLFWSNYRPCHHYSPDHSQSGIHLQPPLSFRRSFHPARQSDNPMHRVAVELLLHLLPSYLSSAFWLSELELQQELHEKILPPDCLPASFWSSFRPYHRCIPDHSQSGIHLQPPLSFHRKPHLVWRSNTPMHRVAAVQPIHHFLTYLF